jgi:hypothetical protein
VSAGTGPTTLASPVFQPLMIAFSSFFEDLNIVIIGAVHSVEN